jgi:antitoxin PrlF
MPPQLKDNLLVFLARDIERRPAAITTISPVLTARITALTEGMEIDLNAEIDGEIDI